MKRRNATIRPQKMPTYFCHESLVPEVGGTLVEDLPVLEPVPPRVGVEVEAGHDHGEVVLPQVEHRQLLSAGFSGVEEV